MSGGNANFNRLTANDAKIDDLTVGDLTVSDIKLTGNKTLRPSFRRWYGMAHMPRSALPEFRSINCEARAPPSGL